ncbi:MAG: histidine kinase [Oscillospiraceae bacterium]|nr:histidine kinase [Oscillospiraceae bacterium]
MQKFIDKIVLLGLCMLAMSFTEIGWASIVTLFIALAVSSLSGFFENRLSISLCIGYVVLCLFVSDFLIFLPLIAYDCASSGARAETKTGAGAGAEKVEGEQTGDSDSTDNSESILWKSWFLRFFWVVALPVSFTTSVLQSAIVITFSSGIAVLLRYRTETQIKGRDELFALRDSTKERAESLEQRNRELIGKQDYEIKLATLAERNRIAREIHDNVGHMLTRSLLQVSALRVTHTDDEELTDELDMIKGTLSDAMDSIRSSVHDLHDESIDLKSRLEAMIVGFMFCPVKLRYDAGDLPTPIKLCFAAIVREALSNIAKHSSATEANITLMEHPSFYQLVISDNGAVQGSRNVGSGGGGIGLQNMSERVDALNGVFRINQTRGFKIFISVPKINNRSVL